MRIKLAILEKDTVYLERIVAAFNMKYADKLEIYSFTDLELAKTAIESNRIDVLLANQCFEIDVKELSERCALAYLVESNDIETVRDVVAVSKFQKADLIYKKVLGLYSEKSSDIIGIHFDENENTRVISFLAPAGGAGCSVAAVSCAMNFAKNNKKVIYLNFEFFGNSDIFFEGEGTADFSDIIYALKSKKKNMALKIESTVKQDASGVYFFSGSKNALDMQELNGEEIKGLLTELKNHGAYDYIIIDFDFNLSKDMVEVLKECDRIVLLSDGSLVSNDKLKRAIETINILEQQYECKLMLKTGVLYNRVSSQNSYKLDVPDVREFGGIKRYEGYSIKQMVKELSTLSVFDALR